MLAGGEYTVDGEPQKYSLHKNPVWRKRADFIINAPLSEESRFEQLWARQVAEDRFELCCIPFFVYDMTLGDVVKVSLAYGRKYQVESVVRPSGRYVFRVFFNTVDEDFRSGFLAKLENLGALYEWSSDALLAVDAEDLEHAQDLSNYFQANENQGLLVYETGRSA